MNISMKSRERPMSPDARSFGLDVLFFAGVPLILAATHSLVGPYVGALGTLGGLLYVAALSFVPWWMAAIATYVVHWALSRQRPPSSVVALIGVVAAIPLAAIYSHLTMSWFQTHWPGGHLLEATQGSLSWSDRLDDIALNSGRAIVLWTAFVVVFATALRWPRFSYPADPNDPCPSPAPAPTRERLRNSGNRWSDESDRELATLVMQRTAPKEIAVRLKRTVGAIRRRMDKLGLRPPSH